VDVLAFILTECDKVLYDIQASTVVAIANRIIPITSVSRNVNKDFSLGVTAEMEDIAKVAPIHTKTAFGY